MKAQVVIGVGSDNTIVSYDDLFHRDFDFHNVLRQSGGKIIFIDFEYFGRDDPAKMISDFVVHPAMELSRAAGCDGESNEGSVWETALSASKHMHMLNNLTPPGLSA